MEKILQVLKISLCLFFLLFSLSFVSAVQTFEQNHTAAICHAVRKDGAIPTSAACNITINYANGSNLVNFLAMDDLGDQFCYNLTGAQTSVKGIYSYDISCDDSTDNATLSSEYLVNLGGIEPTQSRTDTMSRTIFIFFGLAVLVFLSLFWVKKTPFKLSLFLVMIWFILMGINASYISIQDEVLNVNIENFFSFFLVISYWANYAIFVSIAIIWAITFIVSIMEFNKKKRVKDYG